MSDVLNGMLPEDRLEPIDGLHSPAAIGIHELMHMSGCKGEDQ